MAELRSLIRENKFDPNKCIICQKSKKYSVTSTANGRCTVMEAASIRKDVVLERLNLVDVEFVYHMDNECYKSYVLKKTLTRISEAMQSVEPSDQIDNHSENLEPQKKEQGNYFNSLISQK